MFKLELQMYRDACIFYISSKCVVYLSVSNVDVDLNMVEIEQRGGYHFQCIRLVALISPCQPTYHVKSSPLSTWNYRKYGKQFCISGSVVLHLYLYPWLYLIYLIVSRDVTELNTMWCCRAFKRAISIRISIYSSRTLQIDSIDTDLYLDAYIPVYWIYRATFRVC